MRRRPWSAYVKRINLPLHINRESRWQKRLVLSATWNVLHSLKKVCDPEHLDTSHIRTALTNTIPTAHRS